jgi:hypothetical protein
MAPTQFAEEGGTLDQLDEGDLEERLGQLTHAQLEALVDNECHNHEFDTFFEALAPVQRARADEEQLVRSCDTLARASIERAASIRPALVEAAEARARAAEAMAQLEQLHLAQQRAWSECASEKAVDKLLQAQLSHARTRAGEVRTQIEQGQRSADDESALTAYLDAARERHRLELMLIALHEQRARARG